MSTTVDNRVVEMRFNNQQFESGVQKTLSTLDKLKQSLSLKGATQGLEGVNAAANKCNLSGLSNAVENIQAKFSALQVMGITALANITNSAVNAGKKIVSALTIDPIKTGFQEYETQINAVQTILANTQSKGTTLKDVNEALDELNLYADKTIYNFTEMTRNIGTFTAAGIDLDTSVNAIQGIANLAAVSGSTSQQASTAMYQLSQALATGTVHLMDWNSVVNAGMGGQVFQEALKKTSEELNTGAEAAIEAKGSFRESLQTGWLTSEVLTETLKKFTTSGANEYVAEYTGLSAKAVQAALDSAEAQYGEANAIDKASEALAKKSGKSAKEIKQALEFAKTAEDAATKVKTFTQLWDTLKEAAQSGWTQTWEIIVGDFGEAKELLTSISDTVSEMINKSAEARNKLLQGWKDLGGRTVLIESFKNVFENVMKVVSAVGDAFRDIFPQATAQQLYDLTEKFKNFTERIKISDETADKLKRTFKGLFAVLDLVRKAVMTVVTPIFNLFTSDGARGIVDVLLSITAAIGDFFTAIDKGAGTGNFFSSITGGLSKSVEWISNLIKSLTDSVGSFGDIMTAVGDAISKVFGGIGEVVGNAFSWITDNVSLGDILAGLTAGGIVGILKKLSSFVEEFKGLKDGGIRGLIFGNGDGGEEKRIGMLKNVSEVLDGVKESLNAFAAGVKAGTLLAIAAAVGILSASLNSISKLKADDIGKSLGAIGAMFVMLNLSFKSIVKTLDAFSSKGILKSAVALILMATAIKIFASAIKTIADIAFDDVVKGLFTLGVALVELTGALKFLSKFKTSLKSAVAVVVLAEACKILGDALSKFSGLSWDEIARGLAGMGGALTELTAVLAVMSKVGGGGALLGSASLVIAVQSLDEISEALKNIGALSWEQIARGLVGMGGALGELSAASGVLGSLAGMSGIIGSISIDIIVQALNEISEALSKIGAMSWDEIARGLVGMGGALGELSAASGVLGKLGGLSALLGGGALVLAVQSLGDLANAFSIFGGMSWNAIVHGLVGMGGALVEVATVAGLLGNLGGIAALVGAGTITLAVQGLDQLANAFKKFGSMSWDEIKQGLAAMGGALGELALGSLLNTLSLLGSISIGTIAEPLGVLADSVKKWTDVTVPEGFAGSLSSLAGGVTSFTFSGIGAGALSAAAEPLGTLADSVKKWVDITVPEGLGDILKSLADGVGAFTFSGLGSDSVSSVAEPLGTLAGSVKKWADVTVPEGFGEKLEALGNGIGAFNFTGFGSGSISSVAEPLGVLADSVKKWVKVTVPEDLPNQFSRLADAIGKFFWSGASAGAVSSVAEPLGVLADSVKKWTSLKIPEDFSSKFESVKSVISGFASVDTSGVDSVCSSINNITDSITKLSKVKIKNIAGDLVNFASDINGIKISTKSFNDLAGKMVSSFVKSIDSGKPKVKAASTALATSAINAFSKGFYGARSKGTAAGANLVSSLAKGIKSKSGDAKTSVNSVIASLTKFISGKKSEFNSSGDAMMTQFASGIEKGTKTVKTNTTSMLKGCVNTIKNYRSSFNRAGAYLVEGFANGISANTYKAEAKSAAMARKSYQAAKKELNINSPSKVFRNLAYSIPEGFAQGIDRNGKVVESSSKNMAKLAMSSTSNALSMLSSLVDSSIDSDPTIRPVLDLSNVNDGVNAIGRMLDFDSNIGILSNVGVISSMMNRNIQNGTANDIVSAISKLNNSLNNLERPSYNINGITYDDGSNVANAIGDIVRAARIERRV